MTERYEPGALPPDLPTEYADAYLRGYERARGGEPGFIEEPAFLDDIEPEPWYGPTHRVVDDDSPRWLFPLIVGFCVLALVLGAYGLGRLFSDKTPGSSRTLTTGDETPGGKPRSDARAWEGDVRAITGIVAEADCVLPPGTDAAGRRVSYDAVNAVDEDFTSAWRCAGDGVGVVLELSLGEMVRLGEVALVPGYAKTDPQSGTDRYAENNRLTRVRWTFDNGRSIVQELDGSPVARDLQFLRIPPVETSSVRLEILSSVPGPRNTAAISEIVLSQVVESETAG